jgi:betaine-aldehyde dehydrogenase
VTVTASGKARAYKHLIGGSDRSEGSGQIDRHNPANGELVASFADGTREDAGAAVAAARSGFDRGAWPRLAATERARVLLRWAELIHARREDLAVMEAQEVGKPYLHALAEIDVVVEMTESCAGLATQVHGESFNTLGSAYTAMVYREPIGVVVTIIPWNCPAILYAQKVPYALASGCTVVVKPSEFTASTALELSRLALDAGMPEDALHVVTGGGEVGKALVEDPDVDMISFTGSTQTARAIEGSPGAALKRKAYELGGKGATIVFADADLEDAVDGTLWGIYANAGESCCAGARLLVEDSVADEFVERLVERTEQLRVGDPFDRDTDLGALIHQAHLTRVLEYVADAEEQGGRVLTGGERLVERGLERGAFLSPTILDRVGPDNVAFREEIFGPVLATTRFSGLEEAIELTNMTRYGLANSVWTQRLDTAHVCVRELRSGTVWVNTATDGSVQLPFGGYGHSGHGREKGLAGLDEFLDRKTVQIHLGRRQPAFPPK